MPRAKANASPRPANAAGKGGQAGQSATLITVVLALALLAVGAASYQAASLLQYAATTPLNATAASTAALVCDTLKRQDYQRLALYIDPAPVPPAVTTAFDARTILNQLRALDTQDGAVLDCSATPYNSQSVVSTDGATRYQLSLRRAKATQPSSGTLVLRQKSGGARLWLVGRDSSFLTAT